MKVFGYGFGFPFGGLSFIKKLINAFKTRVAADSGTFQTESCLNTTLTTLNNLGLYDKASLILTPNAYKVSKQYSIKPTDGSGDLTFSRASTAMRRNSTGIWESVANNVPRLHYPVGGGCPSWLFEPQRTNLILRSNQFTSVNWVTNGSGITLDNQVLSPDGTVNAATFESVGANALLQNAGGTAVIGQTYTSSIWIKAISGSSVIKIRDVSGNETTVVPTSSWELYQVSLAATSTTGRVAVVIVSSGTKIAVWNGQLELGAYATSPIITNSATVTRIADVLSLTGASPLIGQSEGTVLFDVVIQNVVTNNSIGVIAVDSGNLIRLDVSSSRFRVLCRRLGGSTTEVLQSGIISANTRYKVAIRYKDASYSMVINGAGPISSSTAGVFPSGSIAEIRLANSLSGVEQFGELFPTFFFKSNLTDPECIALTT
jgi:hypothetical protein